MRRFVVILGLLFMVALTVKGNPVDVSKAQTAASKFFEANIAATLRDGSSDLAYSEPHGAFYVFNAGDQGFVIIAGDDAYRPVIGYSNESSFDAENIPPALSDYLAGIAECVLRLRVRGNATASPMVAAEWNSVLEHGRLVSRFGGRGTGYFCQTKWNQNDPYNYCCPEDPAGPGGHAYVGCLATAMAQLMRFWAMPAQGMGSHCYYHENYGEICADFGATTYDWDHMPNVLNNNAPEEEKLAVGTLGLHCGVTIDMGYGPDGSGGASSPIPGVMHQYFDYSEANVQYRRNDFELETWKRMVREQFDMGWPMYYGGCQDGGCHAFVCDGYDDYDMFHFNLGWGGGSDGWYIIDEAPYTSPADAMFNFVPSAIYNITPSAPTELTVDVPVATELHAVIHWTNPTTSLDNNSLSSIEEVVVTRNNQIVQVITEANPGQVMEIDDYDLPLYDTYHYAVYVKANGRYGKHADAIDVTVGPTCQWKVVMTTSDFHGWKGGMILAFNNVGHEVGRFTLSSATPSIERPLLPLGKLSFQWVAPEEVVNNMSFSIKDAEEQQVYSFEGSSDEMEEGVFLTLNNSCGGSLSCGVPENLSAVRSDDRILLTWDAVQDEGYGYIIYRDGQLLRLIPAGTGTTYYDEPSAIGGYCYQVSVLCEGGESGLLTNESCTFIGPCYPPRYFDFELTSSFHFKLKWQAPTPNDGLSGYVLYRRKGDGEYKRIKLLNASTESYTDNNLNQEDDYYYRLYAYYRDSDCYSSPAAWIYDDNVFELHVYYSPTGVTEVGNGVKVFPNPTHGVVRVEADAMTHVTAFNALGQCVLDQETKGETFEWHPVAKGIFLMRIDTQNGVSYTKIVAL